MAVDDGPTIASSRIESIQWLRGIAALLVLIVHAIGASLQCAGAPGPIAPHIPNLGAFGDSGVDLFFVISGFVMAHSLGKSHSARSFLHARFWRIWPLFVLASLVFIAVSHDPTRLAPARLLPSLLILPLSDTGGYHQPALPVGWTLAFEAMFYVLVAATIATRRGAFTLLAVTLAAAGLGFVIFIPWAPARMLINPMAAEFALGIAAWLIWSNALARRARPLFCAAGVLLLGAGIAGLVPLFVPADPKSIVAEVSPFNRVLVWGFPWALVVLGLADETGSGRSAAILRQLGDASYSIYLVHFIAIGVIDAQLPLPGASVTTWLAINLIGPLLAGLAVHRWVERPLLRAVRPRPRTGRACLQAERDDGLPIHSVRA